MWPRKVVLTNLDGHNTVLNDLYRTTCKSSTSGTVTRVHTVPTICMFVKPVRIATCCPAMGILNEHMRFSSTGRGPMNYSGSLITLNSWPHADLIFGLELLSKPMFGALRRDVLFVASSNKK